MKFSLVALAATLAVASAADCDLTKITPLLADPNVAMCTANSGFSFTDLSKLTAESMPKLCASTACKSVLATVKALGLGDCTLLGMKLETDLLTPIATACASGSTATTSNSTAGSSAGSSAGDATVGSSTTTKSKTTTSTSSGSGASASTVDTPATNTTTPAPTTTSSASSVAMAASAAVVVVAAAFF